MTPKDWVRFNGKSNNLTEISEKRDKRHFETGAFWHQIIFSPQAFPIIMSGDFVARPASCHPHPIVRRGIYHRC